jgi:DNA-binding LacI/PurR family transcriptional regulator
MVGREEPLPERPASRLEMLRETLQDRIETGEWRAGHVLPKISALARELSASNSTVVTALRTLEARGLVHRQGKHWASGPKPAQVSSARASSAQPVIVVVQDLPYSWHYLTFSAREGVFFSTFMAEAQRYDVRMRSASVDCPTDMASAVGLIDRPSVGRFVRSLGERYQGALVVARRCSRSVLADWIDALLRYGRPVVWFDRNDEGLPDRPAGRLLVRCHYDETSAISTALEALRSFGHTVALYPYGDWGAVRPAAWKTKRGGLVKALAAEMGMQVHAVEQIEDNGTLLPGGALMKAARAHGATAIIAPRDKVAADLYTQLVADGVRIPQHISMVSFDNRPLLISRPISSVDFGFGHLGHAAFHSLYGVVNVRRDRKGNVAARPYLVDRGSIGVPRRR